MGLYNFKQQFIPMILDGSKQHTIRATRRNVDKPGNLCHLYTGLRQPGARLLGRAPCIRVEEIEINEYGSNGQIWIAGEKLSKDEMDVLAWRDGFRIPCEDPKQGFGYGGCFRLMRQFWNGRLPFYGHIIHWDWNKREGAEEAA